MSLLEISQKLFLFSAIILRVFYTICPLLSPGNTKNLLNTHIGSFENLEFSTILKKISKNFPKFFWLSFLSFQLNAKNSFVISHTVRPWWQSQICRTHPCQHNSSKTIKDIDNRIFVSRTQVNLWYGKLFVSSQPVIYF